VKSGKFFRKILAKLFYIEVWNIGIVRKNISVFLNFPNQKIEWLPNPKFLTFRADPFGFIGRNGDKNIVFEHYNHWSRKGEIRSLKIDDNLKISSEKEILNQQKHLSYPYIFSDGEKKFSLVESYKEKKLTLYKVNDGVVFEKVCDLFEGLEIVDPSIVKHNGKWWLFFTQNNHGDEKLYLAFSDNLSGGWKMHPGNPIKNDITSARPAGEIFSYNGVLFRPAQNCIKTYGGSVMINRIFSLTEENYEEREEIQLYPDQLGSYPDGMHHIASLGENLTLIDGKKKVFAPYKPLLSLARNLCKIFK
jgi:hypothetical protein